jgi:hypothetical protein
MPVWGFHDMIRANAGAATMISHRLIVILFVPIPFLIVAFGVFMGAYALSNAAEDVFGATLMWWVAMFDLMFLVINLIVLFISLTLYVLADNSVKHSAGPHNPADKTAD